MTLYDVAISIPLPDGSYPTVSSHSGEWTLNPNSHSISWTIPVISALDESRSGSLMFTVGGDDAGVFFPVQVDFVAQGSIAGVVVASVSKANGEASDFSMDSLVTVDEYAVV